MALVWDFRILCDKPVYAFNRYAISRSRLYLVPEEEDYGLQQCTRHHRAA